MDNKNYKFFIIAFSVILVLPLLTTPTWFHPAAWGKTIVFRIIISSLLFFLIWQIISKKIKINLGDLLDRKNKVFWPFWFLIALLGIFLLATIFSLNPYFSFWGSPYRSGGFLNFSLYIIFAILAFLIIRKKDWQKIWDFTLIIGALSSIMAILQYFEVFSKHLIPYEGRPPASFGNPIFLAIYLMLLLFLTLSFGLNPHTKREQTASGGKFDEVSSRYGVGVKEKRRLKKLFYFSIILLFLLVILITQTRAAYLGLIMGFIYFFLAYPIEKFRLPSASEFSRRKSLSKFFYRACPKKILLLKIATVAALFLVVGSIYFVNTQGQLPEFVENNARLKIIASRLSFELVFEETRFPAWKIALEAIKEKPILGWGPENFSIAFDKHYDPSFPSISSTWWDRAHNFMLETAVTTGIPALIIYLSLFGVLFYQLQKVKRKNTNNSLVCHGIQAAFIGYITANFFSFDTFSTYLIFFLLVGYSLFLIRKNNELTEIEPPQTEKDQTSDNSLWKSGVILGLLCILILFIWFAALKPLKINKELNWAGYYSTNGKCQKAIDKMEKVLPSHSIIDHYVLLKYSDVLKNCQKTNPEREKELIQKSIQILEEATNLRPAYTRTWILLGNYYNLFVENNNKITPETKEKLLQKIDYSFNRAHELNPKRQSTLVSSINIDLLLKKYKLAKEKSEKCINLNPEFGDCWWAKSLSDIVLGDIKEAQEDIKTANQKGFNINSKNALSQLLKAYSILTKDSKNIEYYRPLIDIYQKLIVFEPNNFQYHASLAYVYRELGEYDKAKEKALIVIELSPESKQNVEDFLKTLPY